MKKVRPSNISSIAALILAAFGLSSAPANALSNRAWVSGHGTDAAGCGPVASPCRSFQYVHDNIIAAGGEIDVLDPAGYGAVAITKAVSIVNDGVGTAGVQQAIAGQNAITINAAPTDAVYLRGLEIDGLGVASNGIVSYKASTLTIVNCVVRRFASNGIAIDQASGGATKFSIANAFVSDTASNGIQIAPTTPGATVTGVISQTTLADNGTGIIIYSGSGASSSVTIVDSTVNKNNFGVVVSQAAAALRIGRSVVSNNNKGILIQSGPTASSYGDNEFNGNATDISGGALTLISMQ